MPDLTLKKVPFTEESDNRLRITKSRTGLDRNYLCRIGYCLSLEEPGMPITPEKFKAAREIDRYTLLGEQSQAYLSFLKAWLNMNGIIPHSDAEFNDYFIGHMNRGVELIAMRVKSLADIAGILPKK